MLFLLDGNNNTYYTYHMIVPNSKVCKCFKTTTIITAMISVGFYFLPNLFVVLITVGVLLGVLLLVVVYTIRRYVVSRRQKGELQMLRSFTKKKHGKRYIRCPSSFTMDMTYIKPQTLASTQSVKKVNKITYIHLLDNSLTRNFNTLTSISIRS